MKLGYRPRAIDALEEAPAAVQAAFFKQVVLLQSNFRHPSLQTKRYRGTNHWQARVNRDWRFYFIIESDLYVILDIIPHPK